MKKNCLMDVIFAALAVCLLSSCAAPHNRSFGFYGKLVDQDGHPVAGAHVKIGVASDTWLSNHEDSFKDYHFVTGKNGKIALNNAFGYSMEISIDKPGYELSSRAPRGFAFAVSSEIRHPDPHNPVIFKMWKEAGKEPLNHASWRGKVACDGTTNRFDLATGHPSKDGNLEIICTRYPVNLPPANIKPYTWKFHIQIIGGSIQPTEDEFTYLAPESGYMLDLSYGQPGDDPKWDRNMPMPKNYYIKTPDGHYGHISLSWNRGFWQSPTILEWDCYINPSGSRNLER